MRTCSGPGDLPMSRITHRHGGRPTTPATLSQPLLSFGSPHLSRGHDRPVSLGAMLWLAASDPMLHGIAGGLPTPHTPP